MHKRISIVIHLVFTLLQTSSDLPQTALCRGHFMLFQFDLAPSGVYNADLVTEIAGSPYLSISPLPKWRYIFCCTFPNASMYTLYTYKYTSYSLHAVGRYPTLSSEESGLSSALDYNNILP